MQTLRKLADIPDERFKPQPQPQHGLRQQDTGRITYVHARVFASARAPDFKQLTADEGELLGKLAALEDRASDVAASLTLVSMGRDRDENILAAKATFMGVFGRAGIDARFLQHVRTNRYGLHYDWEGSRCSYYVGTALYVLMWSFDRAARRTRAILLARDDLLGGAADELGSLRRLIRLEVALGRLHSPFLLAWVALVHLSGWMDASTYYLLTGIRQLEELTGYGPYGRKQGKKTTTGDGGEGEGEGEGEGGIPIDRLTQAAKNIGYVQVNLANQLRHVTIGSAICSHIATRAVKLADYAVEHYVQKCGAELDEFNSTIPTLQRSLNDSSAYVYYLQERVRSQNTVVYALMTREDARINIGLARASKELAEAAKKDSSSMKTIAILTMLFLPGTYFAALWAVPSLKWGQPDVIQPDFWLYWAFTGPSTLLIFAVWFGLHRWRFGRSRELRSGGREGPGYEALEGGTSSPAVVLADPYDTQPSPPLRPPPKNGAGVVVGTGAAAATAPPIPPMMVLGNPNTRGYSGPEPDEDWFQPTYGGDTSAPAALPSLPEIRVWDSAAHPYP